MKMPQHKDTMLKLLWKLNQNQEQPPKNAVSYFHRHMVLKSKTIERFIYNLQKEGEKKQKQNHWAVPSISW